MSAITAFLMDNDGVRHSYYLRELVEHHRRHYLPACSCGWVGTAVRDEAQAARTAYHHATKKLVPLPTPVKRRTGPIQVETMFDATSYDQPVTKPVRKPAGGLAESRAKHPSRWKSR